MAYFNLCRISSFARTLTYNQIPEYIVLQKKAPIRWTRRQKGKMISRLGIVSPRAEELFHMRLLLTRVKGPRSFQDLRTINGILHGTFKIAADALGLLQNYDYIYIYIYIDERS